MEKFVTVEKLKSSSLFWIVKRKSDPHLKRNRMERTRVLKYLKKYLCGDPDRPQIFTLLNDSPMSRRVIPDISQLIFDPDLGNV